jgi:hypothetical protein
VLIAWFCTSHPVKPNNTVSESEMESSTFHSSDSLT